MYSSIEFKNLTRLNYGVKVLQILKKLNLLIEYLGLFKPIQQFRDKEIQDPL